MVAKKYIVKNIFKFCSYLNSLNVSKYDNLLKSKKQEFDRQKNTFFAVSRNMNGCYGVEMVSKEYFC